MSALCHRYCLCTKTSVSRWSNLSSEQKMSPEELRQGQRQLGVTQAQFAER